jgi:hypothetical protein
MRTVRTVAPRHFPRPVFGLVVMWIVRVRARPPSRPNVTSRPILRRKVAALDLIDKLDQRLAAKFPSHTKCKSLELYPDLLGSAVALRRQRSDVGIVSGANDFNRLSGYIDISGAVASRVSIASGRKSSLW